jgi:hypothetical protein
MRISLVFAAALASSVVLLARSTVAESPMDAPRGKKSEVPLTADYVILTNSTSVFRPDLTEVKIPNGTLLKVVKQSQHELTVSFEGANYSILRALTTPVPSAFFRPAPRLPPQVAKAVSEFSCGAVAIGVGIAGVVGVIVWVSAASTPVRRSTRIR